MVLIFRRTPTMKNSLMYKMSYYRFHELYGGHPAQDRVRGQTLPNQGPVLETIGEYFLIVMRKRPSGPHLERSFVFSAQAIRLECS